jgi:hypothetical protein
MSYGSDAPTTVGGIDQWARDKLNIGDEHSAVLGRRETFTAEVMDRIEKIDAMVCGLRAELQQLADTAFGPVAEVTDLGKEAARPSRSGTFGLVLDRLDTLIARTSAAQSEASRFYGVA